VADEAAKDALNEDILSGTKATEMDWKSWAEECSKEIF
jgi:hypothetical protein